MTRVPTKRFALAAVIAGTLVLAACGDDTEESSDATEAPAATEAPGTTALDTSADPKACAAGNTITDGVLTIATGEPAFPPYVINDATPEDGQGFESAVAMAVAKELGFEGAAVTWARTPFDAAIAPGPKGSPSTTWISGRSRSGPRLIVATCSSPSRSWPRASIVNASCGASTIFAASSSTASRSGSASDTRRPSS